MRLPYIFHGQDKEPQPFHIKSNCEPPVQQSVALESYLERVKCQLAEVHITKPRNDLPPAEREALGDLKNKWPVHCGHVRMSETDKCFELVFSRLLLQFAYHKVQMSYPCKKLSNDPCKK